MFLETKKDGVIWSAFVDSYSLNGINITENILRENGFGVDRYVDLACITHFHEDHAKGFRELLEGFTAIETKVIMPMFGEAYYSGRPLANGIKSFIQERYSTRESATKNTLFFNDKRDPSLIWELSGPSHEQHRFEISSLLPKDSTAMSHLNDAPNEHTPNDLSIFLKLTLDDQVYILTGDCTDYTMAGLTTDDFKSTNLEEVPSIKYLKIPHHGSETAIGLLERLENGEISLEGVSACAYNKDATKNRSILERYGELSKELALTRKIEKDAKLGYNYGLVKYSFDMNGVIVDKETQIDKNAILF